jgi:hypothetical protein
MVSLKLRIRLAWKAFRLQAFEEIVTPYHEVGNLTPGECDNNWRAGDRRCSNPTTKCMSRTTAKLRMTEEDHWHLCDSCSKELVGKI